MRNLFVNFLHDTTRLHFFQGKNMHFLQKIQCKNMLILQKILKNPAKVSN